MLNRLRFITLFTLNRSTLYCFSVCMQMPSKEGIWLLNATRRFELVPAKMTCSNPQPQVFKFPVINYHRLVSDWLTSHALLKHSTGWMKELKSTDQNALYTDSWHNIYAERREVRAAERSQSVRCSAASHQNPTAPVCSAVVEMHLSVNKAVYVKLPFET